MPKKIFGTVKSSPHGFKIKNVLNPKENVFSITVTPGSVNSIMPSNMITVNATSSATSSPTSSPASSAASSSTATVQKPGLTEFTIKKDVVNYVVLRCRSNGEYINNAEIIVSEKTPELQTPVLFGLPSSVDVLLGVVFNNQIYQCVTSNICLGAYVSSIQVNEDADAIFPYNVFLVWGETRTV